MYEHGATPAWIPLHFPGQYADAESGLFENWNRFYDPSTGRYLSPDALVNQPNKRKFKQNLVYAYVNNNAISSTDPSGLVAQIAQGATPRLLDAIRKLRGTKTGAALRAAIEKSDTVFIIKEAKLGYYRGDLLEVTSDI